MPRLHGKSGRLSLSPASGGSPETVISLDKFDIDLETPEVDVTSFEDLNEVFVVGIPKVSGTFGGNYDPADAVLFAARAASLTGVPVNALLQPDVLNNPDRQASGPCFVSVKLATGAKEQVKVTGKFTAAGAWVVAL